MVLLVALSFVGALTQTPQSSSDVTQIVTGRIVDGGARTPLAGVRVTLVLVRNAPPVTMPPRPNTVVTDQDGLYTFTGIEPGRYVLNLQKPGYAAPVGPALTRFELRAGERHVVSDVALTLGGVIAGRVLDPAGQPVVNARVMAFRAGAARPGTAGRSPVLLPAGPSAQTNDLGEFRVFGLAADTYYLQASAQSTFGGAIESSPGRMQAPTFYGDTTDPVTAQSVSVAAGETFGEVVIHIAVVAAFEVSGVAVDEAGQPVAGAEVRLMPDDSRMVMIAAGPPNRTRSDARGQFTIHAVANGTYKIVAAAPVIISSPSGAAPTAPGVASGNLMAWSGGASVSVETINGVTTQFRTDLAYQLGVTVNDANVADLRVTAPGSPRRPN